MVCSMQHRGGSSLVIPILLMMYEKQMIFQTQSKLCWISFRLTENTVKTSGLLPCAVSSKHNTEWTMLYFSVRLIVQPKASKWCFTSFCEISNSLFLLFLTSLWGFFLFLILNFSPDFWSAAGTADWAAGFLFSLAIFGFSTQTYLFRAWIFFPSRDCCCSDITVLALK